MGACHELCGAIYKQGGAVGDFKTLTDMVRSAQNNLDKGDWDYLVGAADTEASLRRNRSALESWVFLPRILQDVSKVNTATQLLGQTLRIPVVLPPIGSIQAFTEQGGSAVAQAAAEFGVLQILSSSCAPDFETVAQEVTGPRVYQLYLSGDQAWLDDQIERTIASGYVGFCLTADTQVYSRRRRPNEGLCAYAGAYCNGNHVGSRRRELSVHHVMGPCRAHQREIRYTAYCERCDESRRRQALCRCGC